METTLRLPRGHDADRVMGSFLKALFETYGFDTLPPWPETYADVHAWAKGFNDWKSARYRMLTRPDPKNRSGNVVVRLVPLAETRVTVFETAYEHFHVSIKQQLTGGWTLVIRTDRALNGRQMVNRIQQALLELAA